MDALWLQDQPKFLGARIQRGAFSSSLGHLSTCCLLALADLFLLSPVHISFFSTAMAIPLSNLAGMKGDRVVWKGMDNQVMDNSNTAIPPLMLSITASFLPVALFAPGCHDATSSSSVNSQDCSFSISLVKALYFPKLK